MLFKIIKNAIDVLMFMILILILFGAIQEIIIDHKVLKMDDCIELNNQYYCKVVKE